MFAGFFVHLLLKHYCQESVSVDVLVLIYSSQRRRIVIIVSGKSAATACQSFAADEFCAGLANELRTHDADEHESYKHE